MARVVPNAPLRFRSPLLRRPLLQKVLALSKADECQASLTGARRGEIEGLKWSEVDFNFGMLRKETSKTGAKVIPLGRAPTWRGRHCCAGWIVPIPAISSSPA